MTALSTEQLEFILQSGVLAPSADNHHRIRFEPLDQGLNIWSSQDCLPPAGGYRRVLDLLSLGAVVENLSLAVRSVGMETDARLWPEPGNARLLLQLSWQAADLPNDPLCRAIPLRHTNRKVWFRGPPLSLMEATELSHAAAEAFPSTLTWLDSAQSRRHALRLMRLAEGERFHTQALHEELFSAIRFDVGWKASCEEGLPPGALAVEMPLRPLFASLRKWPVMHALNKVGAHFLLGMRAAYLPGWLAPNLGLISTPDTTDASLLAAGRGFERAWLAATNQGLSLQPMPASALYALEGASLEGVPEALQRRLKQMWQAIIPGQVPLMLFRLGRAFQPAIRTERRPWESYLRR